MSIFTKYLLLIQNILKNILFPLYFRGFFLEVVERIIDPWKLLGWNKTDVMNFLKVYVNCAIELDVFQ